MNYLVKYADFSRKITAAASFFTLIESVLCRFNYFSQVIKNVVPILLTAVGRVSKTS